MGVSGRRRQWFTGTVGFVLQALIAFSLVLGIFFRARFGILNIGGGLLLPGFGFPYFALAVFLTGLGGLYVGAGVCCRLGLTLPALIVAL
jgi:hypothetical protein